MQAHARTDASSRTGASGLPDAPDTVARPARAGRGSYPPWRGICVAVPLRRGSSSHGVGLHFAAVASFLKLELTAYQPLKYVGSSTCVLSTSHWLPSGLGTTSRNSVTTAFSLTGTP